MTNTTIIKADPGHFAIDFYAWGHQRRLTVRKVPIVAWRIEGSSPQPICTQELSDLYKGAVQYPDGAVRDVEEEWHSLAAYMKHVHEKYPDLQNAVFTTKHERYESQFAGGARDQN